MGSPTGTKVRPMNTFQGYGAAYVALSKPASSPEEFILLGDISMHVGDNASMPLYEILSSVEGEGAPTLKLTLIRDRRLLSAPHQTRRQLIGCFFLRLSSGSD